MFASKLTAIALLIGSLLCALAGARASGPFGPLPGPPPGPPVPIIGPNGGGGVNGITNSGIGGSRTQMPGTDAVFNAQLYGASPDGGITDNQPKITAAITAACAKVSGTGGAEVYLPSSSSYYAINSPLVLTCSNIHLHGDSGRGATIKAGYYGGPMLYIVPPDRTGITTGTALLTGTGSAITFVDNSYWLELRDLPSLDLYTTPINTFADECTFKLTSTSTNGALCAFSDGTLTNSQDLSADVTAFSIYQSSGQIFGRMNVAGTLYTIGGCGSNCTVSTNTQYHVALTYDGSTIRLFLNGTSVATQSATGNIVQQPYENVTVGASQERWPDNHTEFGAPIGSMDSIRVSNVARYTSNFSTPTAKFTPDANTLALLNFDNQTWGPGTIAHVGTSNIGYLPVRRPGFVDAVEGTEVSNLSFNGGGTAMGIFADTFVNDTLDNMYLQAPYVGIRLWNNSFESILQNITILVGGSPPGQTGIDECETCATQGRSGLTVIGGTFGIGDYGSGVWTGPVVTPAISTHFPFVFSNASQSVHQNAQLIGGVTDTENSGSPIFAALTLNNEESFISTGSSFAPAGTAPAIAVDGGVQNTIVGPHFDLAETTSKPAGLFHFLTAPSQPVKLMDYSVYDPWSGTPLADVLPDVLNVGVPNVGLLSNAPTCNSSTEGSYYTSTDCDGSCSSGSTCLPSLPTLIHQGVATNGPPATLSVTPTAGHTLVVVAFSSEGNSHDMTVSDNSGSNTWTRRFGCSPGSSWQDVEIWNSDNVAGGTYTISVSSTANMQVYFNETEWQGLANPSFDLAGNCADAITTSSPINGGTLTTTTNNDLIIGGVGAFTSILGSLACGPTSCTGLPSTLTALTFPNPASGSGNSHNLFPVYTESSTAGLWQQQNSSATPNSYAGGLIGLLAATPTHCQMYCNGSAYKETGF